MSFEKIIFGIYFFSIVIGIIASVILLISLRTYCSKLPEEWKASPSLKKFRVGVSFLMIYLICVFLSETIATYLAFHHIYNSYIFSIFFTISTPFLFGFLFIHTYTPWKRFCYPVLYFILIVYLISGGYYDPKCNHPTATSLLLYSLYFTATLLHLTDLLISPKSDNFKFQLKFNLSLLIWSLLATIVNSFVFAQTDQSSIFDIFYYLNLFTMILFYLIFPFIFITEILKLRRS